MCYKTRVGHKASTHFLLPKSLKPNPIFPTVFLFMRKNLSKFSSYFLMKYANLSHKLTA